MKSVKGVAAAPNANGSAILVILVTTLIVLYILFLPPADRAELLGENGGSSNGGSNGGADSDRNTPPSMVLLAEQVGRIDYLANDKVDHPLPSFVINTRSDGSVIATTDSLYVKSSVFDTVIRNVTFKVEPELTRDTRLSFNVGDVADGRLIVLLNGERIVEEDVDAGSSFVVNLDDDDLMRYNTLTFGVDSPGWAFWVANEYQLRNVQVTGTIEDLSGAQSRQTFVLTEDEVDNMQRATLRFFADCQTGHVGRLKIVVNGRTVFSSLGDCGVLNTIELDERVLDWGENEIVFSTTDGAYLFSNVEVGIELEDPVYPIYYFDIDEDYFTDNTQRDEAVCGDIDGVCPVDCSADIDKDCCFELDEDNFWCDVETQQLGDRCVSFVTASTCARCDSGYEDDRGYAPDACEDLCGDDKDGKCPSGCSRFLDKDCCFDAGDTYWCDDVPDNRPLSSVCKFGVEPDERSYCESRYYDESGKRLSFTEDEESDVDEELSSRYEVQLRLLFPNEELKRGTLLVNGRKLGLETRELEYDRDISDYVRSGTNSVQIEPSRTLDITSLRVAVIKD